MRPIWAGLIVLILSAASFGQANGTVTELGYGADGAYRADCWTPLHIKLNSTISEPAEYQIQVHQQDLDQDTVVYTRKVTLGPQAHEEVWAYFLPQPTNGGLRGGSGSNQLADVLKVHLFDAAGSRHIAALDMKVNRATEVEQGIGLRGAKLVLVIGGTGGAQGGEYEGAQGTAESIRIVPIRPEMLPDHVLGFQSVDAILWLDGDFVRDERTSRPSISPSAFSALQEWVRRGGNFAVCQPSDVSQLDPLANADMLPVVAKEGAGATAVSAIQIRSRAGVDHLLNLVPGDLPQGAIDTEVWKLLDISGKKFDVAFARARPDAMVDWTISWLAEEGRPAEESPFIVRRAYGMGSVTWVAQRLGSGLGTGPNPYFKPPVRLADGQLSAPMAKEVPTNGWPRILDRVFGWRNRTRTITEVDRLQGQVKDEYSPGNPVDLGAALAKNTEHSGRSTAYIFIAILFFIGYWIVAGPGSYLFLAARKRKGLSWTVFGASALLATIVTVLVVKLLLGGGTEVRHISIVRLTPSAAGVGNFDANITSRVGLYIPRDGGQKVATPAASTPEKMASVAPYAVHPIWLKDNDAGFTDTARYFVDTDPTLTGKAPSADFVFRSTLKKVQAQWSGQVQQGITGSATLLLPDNSQHPPLIGGKLTNTTGQDLRNVYFFFTYGWQTANATTAGANDQLIYIATWKNGTSLDLATEWAKARDIFQTDTEPGYAYNVTGRIDPGKRTAFTGFLFNSLPTSGITSDSYDDRKSGYIRSLPLLSILDRLGPIKRDQSSSRPEPVRRGFRDLDLSQLVAAGRLVLVAHADEAPVPMQLEVNGDRATGTGTIIYQVSLPLDRINLKPVPVTQPTSQPSTKPATPVGQVGSPRHHASVRTTLLNY